MNLFLIFGFGLLCCGEIVNARLRTCRCTCSSNNENGTGKIVDLSIIDNDEVYDNKNDFKILTTKRPEETPSPKPTTTKNSISTQSQKQNSKIQENSAQNSQFNKCQQNFQTACIVAHNKLRALHHALPLRTSDKLQNTALNFAQYLADRDIFKHSGTRGIGENLAYVWASSVNSLGDCSDFGYKFVQMWYDEINYYNFNNPGFGQKTGHFTQVVWLGTTDLGCGLAISKTNKIYGSCNYSPSGNYIGADQFRKNVLPK